MEFVEEKRLFSGDRFLIFGCGMPALGFLRTYQIDPKSVIGFVESKKSDALKFVEGGDGFELFDGKPIFSINEISSLDFDLIFIANQHYNTLKEVLSCGIPIEKIILTTPKVYEEFKREYPSENIQCAFTSVLTQKLQSKTIFSEQFARFDKEIFLFANDYVRIATLQLLADEVKDVDGEIAELGVFQGDFAKYLNELFPNRTLNLFDTFSGNTSEELDKSIEEGTLTQTASNILGSYFDDTSINLVMSKMKYPERIQIHKGFFPDTIPNEQKTFALVEMDIDLHKPTLAGLKYFYSNLVPGGYIMLSCYNSFVVSEELHQAVRDLEKEVGRIAKFPVADEYGTLVITK